MEEKKRSRRRKGLKVAKDYKENQTIRGEKGREDGRGKERVAKDHKEENGQEKHD